MSEIKNTFEEWNNVQYRMESEGFEYCFLHYDDFTYIKDEEFHKLRLETIAKMQELRNMIDGKIDELKPETTEVSQEEMRRNYLKRADRYKMLKKTNTKSSRKRDLWNCKDKKNKK